ncbi:MAG: hypothetical protein AAGF79_07270 [Pseudomonadota bacterium]
MAQLDMNTPNIDAPVLELIQRERDMALSPRELNFRLAGYGYTIRDTAAGQVVSTLRGNVDLGVLPARVS